MIIMITIIILHHRLTLYIIINIIIIIIIILHHRLTLYIIINIIIIIIIVVFGRVRVTLEKHFGSINCLRVLPTSSLPFGGSSLSSMGASNKSSLDYDGE